MDYLGHGLVVTIQQVLLAMNRGTYATWNPLDKDADVFLSVSNSVASWTSAGDAGGVRANKALSAGKWYWEIQKTYSSPDAATRIGIGKSTASLANALGTDADGYAYSADATKWNNNSSSAYGADYQEGFPVISVLLDLDAGDLVFWVNGVSQGAAFTGISGTFYPMVYDAVGLATPDLKIRPANAALSYAIPAGYSLLVNY